MIEVDTNVLIRVITNDDGDQTTKAKPYFVDKITFLFVKLSYLRSSGYFAARTGSLGQPFSKLWLSF